MKKSKAIFILVLATALFTGISSCTKEPGCGREGECDSKECRYTGTVSYLPAGCGGNSDVLGIRSADGSFIMVCEDGTGKFARFSAGDKVCYDGETVECAVCLACDCPHPDRSIRLDCIDGCVSTQQN